MVVDKNGNLWIGSSWGLTKVDFNPTRVSYTEGLPNSFALHQNYPNPFNPSTKIKYDLSSESKVVIKIYDMLGRELEKLVDENQYAGIYSIEFNATKYSSGIYYYKLQAGNYTAVKKMLLIK
ncbi:MAG: hypothetical protein CVV24_01335 [Ignavibacteriae bacterium HGW-Ignavibacteriae-3]|nr:MAG: hypothetical protein CVV24_01335 [Ignavibacteriae bacterium HGW-Ignavibacteriae-3]